MSLEERIKTAVTPIVPEFAADVYTGDEDSYCVFNATEMPEGFGDNRPRATKRALRAAVGGLQGCTWPTVTYAGDLTGGHLVFEFQAVDGEV